MRYVMLAFGLLVLSVVLAAAWIDEGEIVTLRSSDAEGQTFETELWIAEYGGELYLRGARDRLWVDRIRERSRVEVVRGGETRSYHARLVGDTHVTAGVDAAMAAKYGSADRIAGAVFERRPPVAIRLEPIGPASP
jgi:hypothetical protein